MTAHDAIDRPRESERRFGWKAFATALFLGAALIAAGMLLAREWDSMAAAFTRADAGLVALALAAAMANVAMTAISWRVLLAGASFAPSPGVSARIFFLGQIGKYLPGSLWSFLATGELARSAGIGRGAAMASLALALLIGVGSGLLVAILAVPQTLGLLPDDGRIWAAGTFVAALVMLPGVRSRLLRLVGIDFPVPATAFALSGAVALAAWLFAGAQIILLSKAIGAPLGWSDLGHATGAYAFAWVAGFLVVFAPAGLGAREGSLIAVLALVMGLGEATAIVILSRLVATAADFACAGLATLTRLPRASPAAAPPLHPG